MKLSAKKFTVIGGIFLAGIIVLGFTLTGDRSSKEMASESSVDSIESTRSLYIKISRDSEEDASSASSNSSDSSSGLSLTISGSNLVNSIAGYSASQPTKGISSAPVSASESKQSSPYTKATSLLVRTELFMTKGDSNYIEVRVNPKNSEYVPLTWTSSNVSVAVVDQTGKVTALAPGTTTVIVTGGGLTAKTDVTVCDNVVTSIPVESQEPIYVQEG